MHFTPRRFLIRLCPCLLLFAASAAGGAEIAARASSGEGEFDARNVLDRHWGTRWSSAYSDPQWLVIDYGQPRDLVGLILHWEVAYAYAYDILVSDDGEQWETVFSTTTGDGGIDDVDFDRTRSRYLKILCRNRGTQWGYSLFEVIPKTAEEPWGEGQPGGFFLREVWAFATDDSDFDLPDGKPCPPGEWKSIRTHQSWERQGYKDYMGTAWYHTRFFVPDSWRDARPFIQLTDVRDEYELYIDGRLIAKGDGRRRKVRYALSRFLAWGVRNDFCLKVRSETHGGGVRGGIVLAASPKALQEGLQELRARDQKGYYKALAHMEMEGLFPYYLNGRQGYWTVVGLAGDFKESLFCQDGTLEPYKSFSIMPFLYLDGEKRLLTREDVELHQSLEKSWLPMPASIWKGENVLLQINAFPGGEREKAVTYVTYRIRNTGKEPIAGKLLLAIRPLEINPPWQWGGINNIHNLKYGAGRIEVNEYRIVPLIQPDGVGVLSGSDGEIVRWLEQGKIPGQTETHDPGGLASGVISYTFDLEPGDTSLAAIAVPLYPDTPVDGEGMEPAEVESVLDVQSEEAGKRWEERARGIEMRIPDADIAKTLQANLAYILVNRDGPALQPGSRTYEAAWMRDGALSCAALLRMGYTNEVREFIDWYDDYIYDDGRVPAIVIISRNEVNPVHEYDSQGEFIYTVMQYYRFTRDKAFLESKWPAVVKVLEYLEQLRDSEVREELMERPENWRYYGILPKCVSHEGYYPEPGNHSYWDNFWALRGWKDAREMALVLGHDQSLEWIEREEAELREALYTSIRHTMNHYNIDYIPGCAELGDFDPTSTAVAITACDELHALPPEALQATFDKYLGNVQTRDEPGWEGSFSPYEIRTVQAFLYMEAKERALDLLEHLMQYRVPRGWRQWPEAVYVPEDHGGYIGDMPHTWISSGFINTIRSMLLYEKEKEGVLVLAAGVPERWLDYRRKVSVSDAPTYWGPVSYDMERVDDTLRVRLEGEADPPGGILIRSPLYMPIKQVTVDGRAYDAFTPDEIRIDSLPAEIIALY